MGCGCLHKYRFFWNFFRKNGIIVIGFARLHDQERALK